MNRLIWPVTLIVVVAILTTGAVLTARVLASAPSSGPAGPGARHPSQAPRATTAALMCGTPFAVTGRSCGQAQMIAEPASYGLSADGGTAVTGLSWQDWGQPTALAIGKLERNDCVPDCAQGTYRRYPATVTVTGLRHTGAESYYTLMRVNAPADGFSLTYPLPPP